MTKKDSIAVLLCSELNLVPVAVTDMINFMLSLPANFKRKKKA